MMSDEGLFEATVPVFRHYMRRMDAIVSTMRGGDTTKLEERLAPDMFSAGEHFAASQGFTLRIVFPLIGREVPDLSTERSDVTALARRSEEARGLLAGLAALDFNGAAGRTIDHKAGTADLTQDATTFATLYGLPNFFFHLTMGYATLRQCGIDLGKSDFDGMHSYPAGFRFSD